MIGRIFSRVLVVGAAGKAKQGALLWNCVCSCGKNFVARGNQLRGGTSRSCGCLRRENHKKAVTKHGWARTPEYSAWHKMQQRCRPNDEHRKDYFDRGIGVSQVWTGTEGFLRFLLHAGLRPSEEHSLDRINNDKSYEPGNVRWATSPVQIANRRKRARLDQFSDSELLGECEKRGLC